LHANEVDLQGIILEVAASLAGICRQSDLLLVTIPDRPTQRLHAGLWPRLVQSWLAPAAGAEPQPASNVYSRIRPP